MKIVYKVKEIKEEDLPIFLHTCNKRASTFDRLGEGRGHIYTVITADQQIETYAGISQYSLFEI